MTTALAIATISLVGLICIFWVFRSGRKWKKPSLPFPDTWRDILKEHVSFYNALNDEDRARFEYEVHRFLINYRIAAIQTSVDVTDQLLIAASAVIPIFGFPGWTYRNLKEVLVYPSSFSPDFKIEGFGRPIAGMVGSGYMGGKMILSKSALHNGFANDKDKRHTAIHEFVHLIDMSDGTADGVPEALLERPYAIPWMDMIRQHLRDGHPAHDDIRPYGFTEPAEFFAVASEYFFERPRQLQKKHPELYAMLAEILDQDLASGQR